MGHDPAHMKRDLRTGAKNETVGTIKIAKYNVCLDRRMLGILRLASHFYDFVRLAESLIHISHVDIDISDNVTGRIVDPC